MKIIDISRPVTVGIPVWPGDTAYQFDLGWKMSEGASVNVGSVTMSVHTGSHADAPFHFDPDGAGIGEVSLTPYFGPAVVVDVMGLQTITCEHLSAVDFGTMPRLLLKTGAWTNPEIFPETVPTLAPDVPAYLKERGVLLFGVDVPSVDAIDSTDLPIHYALNAGSIAILESLDLTHVTPGAYTLIALPLRLAGADASPVRAVLIAPAAL
jgi:arylformamidase